MFSSVSFAALLICFQANLFGLSAFASGAAPDYSNLLISIRSDVNEIKDKVILMEDEINDINSNSYFIKEDIKSLSNDRTSKGTSSNTGFGSTILYALRNPILYALYILIILILNFTIVNKLYKSYAELMKIESSLIRVETNLLDELKQGQERMINENKKISDKSQKQNRCSIIISIASLIVPILISFLVQCSADRKNNGRQTFHQSFNVNMKNTEITSLQKMLPRLASNLPIHFNNPEIIHLSFHSQEVYSLTEIPLK